MTSTGTHLTHKFLEAITEKLLCGTASWRIYVDYVEDAVNSGKITFELLGFNSRADFLSSVCTALEETKPKCHAESEALRRLKKAKDAANKVIFIDDHRKKHAS